ncbi:MAG: HAD-IA family hydrolase [Brachybacterium sp.]|nr:HAD-IA family hydrolase [Brachybacterium sp.]
MQTIKAPRPQTFRAHLFDLDGVITSTALVHMRAWDEMFSEFLETRGIEEPYTERDYFDYVDGKPRYDGVRSFLASRGIELPEGTPEDSPDAETVAGLGNRKNDRVLAMIREEGVEPYPGTVAYLDSLGEDALLAVVSSSKNADEVLRGAGLRDRFAHVVDGNVASAEGIPGKPAPDTFSHAARLLGAEDTDCVVYEDAVSGVRAGAAGGFGLVVGVDRGVGHEVLADAGADVVVSDLEELL